MLKKTKEIKRVYYSLDPEEDARIKAEKRARRRRWKKQKSNHWYWLRNKDKINKARNEKKRQRVIAEEGYDPAEKGIRVITEISYEDSTKTRRNSKIV